MKKVYTLIILLLAFFSLPISSKALTNISINNNKLIPDFDINTKIYNVFVSSKIEIITINIEEEEGEIVTGGGSISLKKGLNEIKIISYKNEEAMDTYTLNIVRGEINSDKKDATLKSLYIKNHEIEFSSDIFLYNLKADTNENRVDINYETTNPNSKVKLTGDVNLNKEKNIIRISVTSEDKKTTNTYTIKITKKLEKNDKTKKESIFDNKEFSKTELKFIIIGLIFLGLILLGILFYFMFIKKTRRK